MQGFSAKWAYVVLLGAGVCSLGLASAQPGYANDLPRGTQSAPLQVAQLAPQNVDPYIWSAVKADGGSILLEGYVPSAEVQSRLMAATGAKGMATTSVADGAPDGFAETALSGIQYLGMFETGTVKLDGEGWHLIGTAFNHKNGLMAQTALEAAGLRAAGWTIDLNIPSEVMTEAATTDVKVETPDVAKAEVAAPAIPQAANYQFSLQMNDDDTLLLSGFVPSTGLQKLLAVRAGDRLSDTTSVASGAPKDFITIVLVAFDAVNKLQSGEVRYEDGQWSLSGIAENKKAVTDELEAATSLDGWQVALENAVPALPEIAPYRWLAEKSADGKIHLSGHVPNAGLQRYLIVRTGNFAEDMSEPGAGAPDGFAMNAVAAIAALNVLESGRAGFDGTHWNVSGVPESKDAAQEAVAALSSATLPVAQWMVAIGDPPAPAPEMPKAEPQEPAPVKVEAEPKVEEPAISAGDPAYVFRATMPRDQQMMLLGQVPAQATASYLGVIAGENALNNLKVAENAPTDFIANAIGAVQALSRLRDGNTVYYGGQWALSGTAKFADDAEAAKGIVAALPDGSDWSVNISTTPPIEVCREEVTNLFGENTIIFGSGSDRIAQDSAADIEHLATYLQDCPKAQVHVEGHTDSDGDDESNLALSVARAEAVLDQLIALGVSEDRLYAVGYGETLPIDTNETSAGKRHNRRIVFNISDGN